MLGLPEPHQREEEASGMFLIADSRMCLNLNICVRVRVRVRECLSISGQLRTILSIAYHLDLHAPHSSPSPFNLPKFWEVEESWSGEQRRVEYLYLPRTLVSVLNSSCSPPLLTVCVLHTQRGTYVLPLRRHQCIYPPVRQVGGRAGYVGTIASAYLSTHNPLHCTALILFVR